MANPVALRPGLLARRTAMAAGALLLAVLWLGAAAVESWNALAHGAQDTAMAAHAVADSMERATGRFLALTRSFGPADLAPAARMRSTTELLRVQAAFDAASAVFLANASGRVVAASSPLPGGSVDVAGSNWFKAGLAGGRDTVSATRVEASWLWRGSGIVLIRVLTGPDGAPVGLIGALLPTQPAPATDNAYAAAAEARPAWTAPAWAPAGTTIAVVTAAGTPVVSTRAGGAQPSPPADAILTAGARAFIAFDGSLGIPPVIEAAAAVPRSDLRVIARLPRALALSRAWPAARLRLAALGAIELLLLAAWLLASVSRSDAGLAAEPVFGHDWGIELDREQRVVRVSGLAPDALRRALGKPLTALPDPALRDAIARHAPEGSGRIDGIVLRLPDADRPVAEQPGSEGTGSEGAETVHRAWLERCAGGGWRGGGRDVTAETAAIARAATADRAAATAQHQFAELVRDRDRVLAAVGHDVRTPMSSILGICSLLLEGHLEDEQRTWILRMRASGEALLAMLNGLLEVASLDCGAATLQECEVDVADLVRDVVEMLAPLASEKGLNLAVRQDEALAGLWMTDPTRLRQLLFNLLDNAVKYTDAGKVEVRTAVLSGADGEASIRITVSDSGPGIAPEERVRIFERFKRGADEREHGGLGLGLALCRDIANLMGGRLTVESTRGVGSEFTFVVPANRVPDRFEQMPYAGHTCVVIGFVGELQRRLPERLAALGFTVEYAPDGFIGFGLAERIATQRGVLDLVVLDGALLGMDAAHLARRLQAAAFTRTTRILGVLPQQGDTEALASIVDATVAAGADSAMIARAAGRLVADRSPLAALEAGMAEAAGRRVLIVEDNKINQALLSAALAGRGFTTFVADNGEDAVRILELGGFDAVLMDIQIPGINGLEATRRIREGSSPSRAIPIIALTALSSNQIQERCDTVGITAIVTKPVNAERLGHLLNTWIAQGAAAQPQAEKDEGAFKERDNARWLGQVQRSWIAQEGEASPPDDAADRALESEDEDTEVAEVSDAFLECLIADIGIDRARLLVQTFGRDAMARTRQLRELLPAWEVGLIITICQNLDGVASSLGAVALSECLESTVDAARRGAKEEAAQMIGRFEDLLVPTLSILMARLASLGDHLPKGDPKAA